MERLKRHSVALYLLICLIFSGNAAFAQLLTHVDGVQNGTLFTYTVFNDEPAGSTLFITTFSLSPNAPFTVISSPAGWDYQTDNISQIDWYNTDPVLPYPHDIAPGSSVSFVIQSNTTATELLGDGVTSWDHGSDSGGPSYQGNVIVPSTTGISSVPESSSPPFLGAMTLSSVGLLFGAWRRSHRTKA